MNTQVTMPQNTSTAVSGVAPNNIGPLQTLLSFIGLVEVEKQVKGICLLRQLRARTAPSNVHALRALAASRRGSGKEQSGCLKSVVVWGQAGRGTGRTD